MKIAVIFYKGKPDWQDLLIRLATFSKHSHCEVMTVENGIRTFYGVNANTGKVSKFYRNNYNPEDWDELETNKTKEELYAFFTKTKNMKYDWVGIFLSKLDIQKKDKYFCSEWIAEFLGLKKPHRFTPGRLYKTLKKLISKRL